MKKDKRGYFLVFILLDAYELSLRKWHENDSRLCVPDC